MPSDSGSFCLVANDLDYVIRNGGIGTSNWLTAHLLAKSGWRVHILYCGPAAEPARLMWVREQLQQATIGLTCLQDLAAIPFTAVPPQHMDVVQLRISEHVRHALESLHQAYHFDLVQFADWDGLGFHTAQAKQAGLAFDKLGIIVKLQGNHPWSREGNYLWPNQPEDWLVDYLERFSLEHADFQLSCSTWFLEYARQLGWHVRPDARVCSLPYPDPLVAAPTLGTIDALELVFFGRLETHKGLEIFLDALPHIDPHIPLTFLGKPSILRHGGSALDLIRTATRGRRVQLLTDYNREEALRYLASRTALVIMPSLGETFGNAIAECAVNGFPFLATGSHGHLDLLPDEDLRAHLFFRPNPQDLVRCLRRYLSASAAQRLAWRTRILDLTNPQKHNQRIVDDYHRCLEESRASGQHAPSLSVAAPNCPRATVVVTHRPTHAYLPECLASLAAQTYPNLLVLVIDPARPGTAADTEVDALERRYPQFRFLRPTAAEPLDSQNRALAAGAGEYYIPFESDHIAMPTMIEQMVACLRRNPTWIAATCYVLTYKRAADLEKKRFRRVYKPTGGPFVLGAFVNVFGESTAIFRAAALRAWGDHPAPPGVAADWWLYATLAGAGHPVGVIPAFLYCSRLRESWRAEALSQHLSRMVIRQQYERSPALSLADRRDVWKALFTGYPQLQPTPVPALRYLLADKVNGFLKNLPALHAVVKRFTESVAPGSAPTPSPVLRYHVADRANAVLRKVRPLHRLAKRLAVLVCLPQLVPWLLSSS